MPVLAVTGQQARAAIGGRYQQEVDPPSMFKDVAGAFVQQASAPAGFAIPRVWRQTPVALA
jgi:pyruvate dehydrogenase (quinone)